MLTRALGSQRRALVVVGVSRSTWHYRRHPRPRVVDPIPQARRAYRSRIGPQDRARIQEYILAGWAKEVSVDHSFATAWDQGVMLASRRSWWRIAKDLEDQVLRPEIPTKKSARAPREAPVVVASGPGQAWSWDITDLLTPWRGVVFKGYKITDVFSREIVGWRVEEREADHLAVEMFHHALSTRGAPEVVHADSGAAMRSNLLRDFLEGTHHIDLSFNRAYVSNDNPFSEAGFRTMKYRPGYPRVFDSLEGARAYIGKYVPWYNNVHKHSGIALSHPHRSATGPGNRCGAPVSRRCKTTTDNTPNDSGPNPAPPPQPEKSGSISHKKNNPQNNQVTHHRLTFCVSTRTTTPATGEVPRHGRLHRTPLGPTLEARPVVGGRSELRVDGSGVLLRLLRPLTCSPGRSFRWRV